MRDERTSSVHFEVRDATAGDAPAVADLFYNTILNVNVGDYSVAQVEAWAGPAPDPEMWGRRITEGRGTRRTFLATTEVGIVGFAELEGNGHLDTLYVHHEYQGVWDRLGVARPDRSRGAKARNPPAVHRGQHHGKALLPGQGFLRG